MRAILLLAIASCMLLVAATPVLAWTQGGPRGDPVVSTLVVALCAGILVVARRLRLPLELTLVLLVPFAIAWGLGFGLELFKHVRRFDFVVHTTAAACLGALVAGWVLALPLGRWRLFAALVCGLALTALVGSAWEVGELFADVFLGVNTLVGPRNTAYDLTADLLGGFSGAVLVVVAARRAPSAVRERLGRAFRRLQPERA